MKARNILKHDSGLLQGAKVMWFDKGVWRLKTRQCSSEESWAALTPFCRESGEGKTGGAGCWDDLHRSPWWPRTGKRAKDAEYPTLNRILIIKNNLNWNAKSASIEKHRKVNQKLARLLWCLFKYQLSLHGEMTAMTARMSALASPDEGGCRLLIQSVLLGVTCISPDEGDTVWQTLLARQTAGRWWATGMPVERDKPLLLFISSYV